MVLQSAFAICAFDLIFRGSFLNTKNFVWINLRGDFICDIVVRSHFEIFVVVGKLFNNGELRPELVIW